MDRYIVYTNHITIVYTAKLTSFLKRFGFSELIYCSGKH